MPLFQYKAVDHQGKKIIGMLNADSLQLAKDHLRKQKILVTKLTHSKHIQEKKTLPSSLVLNITNDLHILLRAGLPLYDTLLTMQEKYHRTKAGLLLIDLSDQIKEGKHLSQALATYPRIFDPIYLSIVKAGEESGHLMESFKELSKLTFRTERLKKKIKTAMIYPAFLGGLCLAVISGLLFFLIPSMAELFEGRTLHPLTSFILKISQNLNEQAFLIFSLFIVSIFLLIYFFKQKPGKQFFQKTCLKFPLLTRFITEAILSRFCRVLSVLLTNGIPLLEALQLSRLSMNHFIFEEIIKKAESRVVEGKKLSKELEKETLIPSLVVRMISLAEESGNMAQIMHNISEIYEEDLEQSLTRLTAFLQPAVLLFLGVIVTIVLLAVLLPLTDVGSMLD